MNIGFSIKELRKRHSLSQGDLALKLSISQTALSQIETGASNPSKKTIEKLCSEFGIPEPLLYILGMDISDVPEGKREIFQMLFPAVKDLTLRILDGEQL